MAKENIHINLVRSVCARCLNIPNTHIWIRVSTLIAECDDDADDEHRSSVGRMCPNAYTMIADFFWARGALLVCSFGCRWGGDGPNIRLHFIYYVCCVRSIVRLRIYSDYVLAAASHKWSVIAFEPLWRNQRRVSRACRIEVILHNFWICWH